jgi:hypothetical protein
VVSAKAEAASLAGTATHAELEEHIDHPEEFDDGLLAAFTKDLANACGEEPTPITYLQAEGDLYGAGVEVGIAWDPRTDTAALSEARGVNGYPPRVSGDLRIRGTIDLLRRANRRIILADYKTGRPDYSKRPMELPQMRALGYFVWLLTGEVPILAIGQTKIGRWWLDELDVPAVRLEMQRLRERILTRADHVLVSAANVRLSGDNEVCRFCDSRSQCPRWSYTGERLPWQTF